MKKYFVLTTVVAVFIVLFSACEKEGVYNPTQKISKIYTQISNDSMIGTKNLAEIWTWDGNKLVKIDYMDGSSQVFEYDGNIIKGVIINDGGKYSYVAFTYGEKSILQQIDYYVEGALNTKIVITHNGDKISNLVITNPEALTPKSNDVIVNKTNAFYRVIRFVVSETVALQIKNQLLQKSNSTSTSVTYEYDGNNVKVETSTTTTVLEGVSSMTIWKTTFTYDTYKNPFYNALSYGYAQSSFCLGLSENNITQKTETDMETLDFSTTQYTYTYDGKYPSSVEQKFYIEDSETEKDVYSHSITTFYEYK